MLSSYTVNKVQKIFKLIEEKDFGSAITELKTSSLTRYFGQDLIDGFCVGLSSGAWSHLAEMFLQNRFMNEEGLIFWIAPFRQFRNGKRQQEITGILGVAPIRTSYSQIREVAEANFGGSFHEIAEIVGFRRIASCGLAGGRDGEAFLVPNGWQIGAVATGVALNDMTEQYARIRAAESTVRAIVHPDSADLILDPVLDTIDGASLQNLEFQYHEVAHGIGAGFSEKMQLGLFKSFHNCAVEEWRSDGVSFSLMSELLDDETRGRLVAANIALRLSVDALRNGGFEGDHDAYATALSIQDLMLSEQCVLDNGKLKFLAQNHDELAHAVDFQRAKAWEITSDEIDVGLNKDRLNRIYESAKLSNEMKQELASIL